VTVHSNQASKLKFSNTPDGATSDTIQVTIPFNHNSSSDFYAHAFDSSGPVGYTISAPGYGSVDSTVTLAASGLVIQTPFGVGKDFTTAPGMTDATLTVSTARLDGGNPVEYQAVASGVSIPVTVTSAPTSVGTITVSPITIGSAQSSASTEFHAVAVGTATITASSDGYASVSVNANVQQGTITVFGGTVGQYLEDMGSVFINPPAPPGGLDLTLQSNSSSLKLTAHAGDVPAPGNPPLVLHFEPNTNAATFYFEGVAKTGSGTFSATASGYSSGGSTVYFAPSAVVIYGSPTVSLAGGPQAMALIAAQLDSSGYPVIEQALGGGAALSVSLTNTNDTAGTVPSEVTIQPGESRGAFLFTPVTAGLSTIVRVVKPTGWTTPAIMGQLSVFVN